MIDYTPHRQYKEIVDFVPQKKDVVRGKIVDYLLLFIYVVLLGWGIIKIFQSSSIGACVKHTIVLIIIAIFVGVIFLFIHWLVSLGSPRLKTDYSIAIKNVIGFDF